MHPYIPSALGQFGLIAGNVHQTSRTTPAKYSSGEAIEPLFKAAKERAAKLAPDSSTNKVRLQQNVPSSTENIIDRLKNSSDYASHTRVMQGDKHVGSEVRINPNNSREYLAHELGHHITDQTKVGRLVRNLRSQPKTAIALAAAGGGLGAPR